MSDGGPSSRKTVRLRIEGRVQGVGFRAWFSSSATGLGLDGWVANRRDGGVEAVVAGPEAAVDALIAACHRGPPAAVVPVVKAFAETETVRSGMEMRPTR